MKQAILFIIAISTAVTVFGQDVFTHVSIDNQHSQASLNFTTQNEVNVRYYRIEASNDNQSFDIIGRVPANTNSMKAVNHSYNLAGHDYTYYRVAKISMDGSMPRSIAVSIQPATPNKKEYQEITPAISTDGAVVNK